MPLTKLQDELTPALNRLRLRRQLRQDGEDSSALVADVERAIQEEAQEEPIASAAVVEEGSPSFGYHPVAPADGPATVYVEDGLEFCGTCNVDSVSHRRHVTTHAQLSISPTHSP